jgi:hypothetical protein
MEAETVFLGERLAKLKLLRGGSLGATDFLSKIG